MYCSPIRACLPQNPSRPRAPTGATAPGIPASLDLGEEGGDGPLAFDSVWALDDQDYQASQEKRAYELHVSPKSEYVALITPSNLKRSDHTHLQLAVDLYTADQRAVYPLFSIEINRAYQPASQQHRDFLSFIIREQHCKTHAVASSYAWGDMLGVHQAPRARTICKFSNEPIKKRLTDVFAEAQRGATFLPHLQGGPHCRLMPLMDHRASPKLSIANR